jgi:exonuclease SbcD
MDRTPLRILHTSDWHVGVSFERHPRDEDHRYFFAWLEQTIRERAVDVLVVAGDLFDVPLPSAEALRLLYDLLARLARSSLAQVILVGGNHDSAARLEAPSALLRALSLCLVGGLDESYAAPTEQDLDRLLVPIAGAAQTVRAVGLAVPYVHEYHLGVRIGTHSAEEQHQLLRGRLEALYRKLADRAQALYPGVPLFATGHLTCPGGDDDDSPAAIHQVGTIGALPPSIFDPRIDYIALGHLHRCFRVAKSRAWYSGSPLPLSVKESRSPRQALLVELGPEPGAEPRVERLTIPLRRKLVELRGPLDTVRRALRDLEWSEPAPPLVRVDVEVAAYQSGLQQELTQLQQERETHGPAPRLARVAQLLVRAPSADMPVDTPPLRSLTLEEVFRLFCHDKQVPLDEELLGAFRELVSAPNDEPLPSSSASGAPSDRAGTSSL